VFRSGETLDRRTAEEGLPASAASASAIIAGWLLPHVGFFLVGGILAESVDAVIGAVILLLVIGLVRRAA